jgi:hypothetical protein
MRQQTNEPAPQPVQNPIQQPQPERRDGGGGSWNPIPQPQPLRKDEH